MTLTADAIADRLVEDLAHERGPLTERRLREALTEAVHQARRMPAPEEARPWRIEGRLPTKFSALDYLRTARGAKPEIPAMAIASLISLISAMPDPRVGQNVYFHASGRIDDLGGDVALAVKVEPIFIA
jgi:hypothetical protein